jgi:hypothetical protein
MQSQIVFSPDQSLLLWKQLSMRSHRQPGVHKKISSRNWATPIVIVGKFDRVERMRLRSILPLMSTKTHYQFQRPCWHVVRWEVLHHSWSWYQQLYRGISERPCCKYPSWPVPIHKFCHNPTSSQCAPTKELSLEMDRWMCSSLLMLLTKVWHHSTFCNPSLPLRIAGDTGIGAVICHIIPGVSNRLCVTYLVSNNVQVEKRPSDCMVFGLKATSMVVISPWWWITNLSPQS